MLDGCLHIEPLEFRLLAGNDHVHIIPTAQTVIGDGKQTVRVRRKVYTDEAGLFIHNEINEARVLVAEAVVVLAPNVRGKQIIE